MAGLWRGLGPNVARNAIVNAAELASYDQVSLRSMTSHAVAGIMPVTLNGGCAA